MLIKSIGKHIKYRFHRHYYNENLILFDNYSQVKGNSDNFESRISIIEPSVEIKPLKESFWAFKIL